MVVALREAYQEKMEAQLREWAAKLEVLKAKAGTAGADLKIEYIRQVEMAQGRLDVARRELDELKGGSDEAWDDLRMGMDKAWRELKGAVESAFQELK